MHNQSTQNFLELQQQKGSSLITQKDFEKIFDPLLPIFYALGERGGWPYCYYKANPLFVLHN